MGVTTGLVLYAITWFMTLFVVLPIGLRTQGDEGEVVPGTHAGSPANFDFWRTIRRTTLWGTLVWALIAGTILSGLISVSDYDWANRMHRSAPSAGGDTGG